MFEVPVNSINDLEILAEKLLNEHADIKVWLFRGDLGAGKTTFIKVICEQLGVQDPMSSPSFALVNEYLDSSQSPVYHFDLYRIKDAEEIVEIGLEEYLDSGNFCFIEWPDMIEEILEEVLPSKVLEISIILDKSNTRMVTANRNGNSAFKNFQ